jgi:hypothetical protein
MATLSGVTSIREGSFARRPHREFSRRVLRHCKTTRRAEGLGPRARFTMLAEGSQASSWSQQAFRKARLPLRFAKLAFCSCNEQPRRPLRKKTSMGNFPVGSYVAAKQSQTHTVCAEGSLGLECVSKMHSGRPDYRFGLRRCFAEGHKP